MFIYIAHAEADQAAADDLKAFLKSRGMVVETETGARGFKHLQASDVVIGLWSQKSVFAAHRLHIERRMLDAWADSRLALVKLDHGVLPVGLRDLRAIDAGFERNRQLAAWPQVERAAKEAMNRALVEKLSSDQPAEELVGAGKTGKPGVRLGETSDLPSRSGRFPILFAFLATVGVALIAAVAWQFVIDPEGKVRLALPLNAIGMGTPVIELTTLQVALVGGVLGAALVIALFGSLARSRHRRPSARQTAAARKQRPASAASGPAPARASNTVFISYSHVDDAAVEPVVKVVRERGREVWIDKSLLKGGDGWAGEIVRAIKGTKGMMVMCSKQAFESDHVKREVYLADRYKKPLAPIFLEDAKPPDDFEYFFAGVQWLELWKLPEADRAAAIGKALEAV